jgi:hypothetical protein
MPGALLARQKEELEQFIESPQARAVAAMRLRWITARPTADDIDDVLAEARFLIVRRFQRHGALTAEWGRTGAVEAYCTRVIRNIVVSRLRDAQRRPVLDSADPQFLETVEDIVGPDPAALPAEVFDDVRTALHQRVDHARTWSTAAALAFVTVTEHPDQTLRQAVPRPDDANESGVAEWTSLHYAGRGDCFPPPDSPAIRQRRSRAIRQMKAELVEAARTAGLGPDAPT